MYKTVKWKIIILFFIINKINKQKLNLLTISGRIRIIYLAEKGGLKKCEINKECNVQPNKLASIMKQKNTILMFNDGNMKKMRMTSYLDIYKRSLK